MAYDIDLISCDSCTFVFICIYNIFNMTHILNSIGIVHTMQRDVRFFSKVSISESGCWEWTAHKDKKGYGKFMSPGSKLAHRFLYDRFVGKIPPGLQMDHLCRNRACVNPKHLEQVTNKENWIRGFAPSRIASLKDTCKWGHKYTKENEKFLVTREGEKKRYCQKCRTARSQRLAEEAKKRKLITL